MDAADKAAFLQFCTGTPRVPLEGFQALQGSDGPRKFTIQRVGGSGRDCELGMWILLNP